MTTTESKIEGAAKKRRTPGPRRALPTKPSPIWEIRHYAAALLGDQELKVQSTAAARRRHPGRGGEHFTATALFNAENNGGDVRIETVVGWAEAWGVDVVIEARKGAEVEHRFNIADLDGQVKWAAMEAVVRVMGYEPKMVVTARAFEA